MQTSSLWTILHWQQQGLSQVCKQKCQERSLSNRNCHNAPGLHRQFCQVSLVRGTKAGWQEGPSRWWWWSHTTHISADTVTKHSHISRHCHKTLTYQLTLSQNTHVSADTDTKHSRNSRHCHKTLTYQPTLSQNTHISTDTVTKHSQSHISRHCH